MVDKWVAGGVKKLFGLVNTKIRLAEEANTIDVKPKPLPLVKLFSGVDLNTVAECKLHRQRLKDGIDYGNGMSVASTVLQLCDIIEGVKYGFELPEYMPLLTAGDLSAIEAECVGAGEPLNILLMTSEGAPHSVYFGDDPPAGVRHYSRVISGIAPFLHHAYSSQYLSDGIKLKNINIQYGSKTLLGNAVYYTLIKLSE